MNTSCNIDQTQIYTLVELQDEYPRGVIQAIGELPTLKSNGSLDSAWLQETIDTLYKNRVIPTLIAPTMGGLPSTPVRPVPPPPPPPAPVSRGASWSSYPINILWSPNRRTSWGRGFDTEGRIPFCPVNASILGAGSPVDSGLWGAMLRRFNNNQTLPDGSTFNACFTDMNAMKKILENIDDGTPDRHGISLDVMQQNGSVTRPPQKDYTSFSNQTPAVSNVNPCGTLGRPSSDGGIRLYTQAECDALQGNFSANGECTKRTGGSWSWDCRTLNTDSPDEKLAQENLNYQRALNSYNNTLQSIKGTKQEYNNAATIYNQKNRDYKAAMKTEYCFYSSRLYYVKNSFIKTTADPEVPGNDKMVNYKYSIIDKLNLKMLILRKIAELTFKNDISLIEA